MPALRDPGAIRAILHTDTAWAVYALGDLDPALFAQSTWFCSAGEPPALVLLYRGFEPPALFALGAADAVQGLLGELDHDGDLSVGVRPEIVPLLRDRYDFPDLAAMWRMTLPVDGYRPTPAPDALLLRPADVPALERLYADGAASGEAPDAFLPSMVERGVFYGIHEGAELVAAAGTHLVVPAEGVAAVGCIYTRRDRRGRGLAARATSAVVSHLVGMGVPTVALNVNQRNAPAIHVYERLGFVHRCAYYEGLAVRQREAAPAPAPLP